MKLLKESNFLERIVTDMPFKIVRNDITKMSVDAIVNAANTSLKKGGGVCGAIFEAAGARELQDECDMLGGCKTGEAVWTKGYKLPAKYIIHTVGPIWSDGKHQEEELLQSCYRKSLEIAKKLGCKSIAFPLISSGIYGYPKEEALKIAIASIQDFLFHDEMMVYLVVFDKKAFALSGKLFSDIEKFIDDNYVDEHQFARIGSSNVCNSYSIEEDQQEIKKTLAEDSWETFDASIQNIENLEKIFFGLDESFSEMLLRIIDEKGMTDVQTYKKANIDRKLFSKIRGKKDYTPSKITAIAFAIALELDKDNCDKLLEKAGYALSRCNKFDLIIEYFIEHKIYDVFLINETLFAFDQVLLGA